MVKYAMGVCIKMEQELVAQSEGRILDFYSFFYIFRVALLPQIWQQWFLAGFSSFIKIPKHSDTFYIYKKKFLVRTHFINKHGRFGKTMSS